MGDRCTRMVVDWLIRKGARTSRGEIEQKTGRGCAFVVALDLRQKRWQPGDEEWTQEVRNMCTPLTEFFHRVKGGSRWWM